MASLGSGVELRAKVIRIQFSLTGEAVRRTLKREHRALALTPEKLAVLQELGGWAAGRRWPWCSEMPTWPSATSRPGLETSAAAVQRRYKCHSDNRCQT